jgi:hypothetical protein
MITWRYIWPLCYVKNSGISFLLLKVRVGGEFTHSSLHIWDVFAKRGRINILGQQRVELGTLSWGSLGSYHLTYIPGVCQRDRTAFINWPSIIFLTSLPSAIFLRSRRPLAASPFNQRTPAFQNLNYDPASNFLMPLPWSLQLLQHHAAAKPLPAFFIFSSMLKIEK